MSLRQAYLCRWRSTGRIALITAIDTHELRALLKDNTPDDIEYTEFNEPVIVGLGYPDTRLRDLLKQKSRMTHEEFICDGSGLNPDFLASSDLSFEDAVLKQAYPGYCQHIAKMWRDMAERGSKRPRPVTILDHGIQGIRDASIEDINRAYAQWAKSNSVEIDQELLSQIPAIIKQDIQNSGWMKLFDP